MALVIPPALSASSAWYCHNANGKVDGIHLNTSGSPPVLSIVLIEVYIPQLSLEMSCGEYVCFLISPLTPLHNLDNL